MFLSKKGNPSVTNFSPSCWTCLECPLYELSTPCNWYITHSRFNNFQIRLSLLSSSPNSKNANQRTRTGCILSRYFCELQGPVFFNLQLQQYCSEVSRFRTSPDLRRKPLHWLSHIGQCLIHKSYSLTIQIYIKLQVINSSQWVYPRLFHITL